MVLGSKRKVGCYSKATLEGRDHGSANKSRLYGTGTRGRHYYHIEHAGEDDTPAMLLVTVVSLGVSPCLTQGYIN